MVSRVEKIVFIIRDSFFELYGEKRKVWNRKRKRISWSNLLYEISCKKGGDLWEEDQQICQEESSVC